MSPISPSIEWNLYPRRLMPLRVVMPPRAIAPDQVDESRLAP